MKLGRRHRGYTIYRNPSDQPGMYVVRGWDIDKGGKVKFATEAIAMPITDEALQTVRLSLDEQGLVCVGRQEHDDPVIVESWL